MKIITLTETQFDTFAKQHKYRSFYQTSNYGKIMKTDGYDFHFIGFLNNSNQLIGASLLLYKKVYMNYKIAYAPYGFLIDYTNSNLIEEMTIRLKKLLLKQHFIYIKINPLIHCAERDRHGKVVSYNPEINNILEILKNNGYIHHGFNKYFENQKPRWNAITKLITTNENIYYNLSKQVRNKINKANRSGVDVFKATTEDLTILYEFIKKKQKRSLEYYQSILDNFQENAEIYLAYINPNKYIRLSKETYEKELIKNDDYNKILENRSSQGKDVTKIINLKMESDKRLGIYKQNLIKATTLFQEHPEGIIIGGALVIKYDKGANLLIEGFNQDFTDYNPNYLLKWELIKKYNTDGYSYFNLNGITGEFNEKNKYTGLNEMKLGFSASAIEYLGEFDLIINKTIFNMYKKKTEKNQKNN